jgi:hypothetical protein
VAKKQILIIYFSYSSQTRNLIQAFAAGLAGEGVVISWQPLKPKKKLQFPLGSVTATLVMMVETFFRRRIEIEPIDHECFGESNLVILAGPTWSYNPSGPVLSFLDNYGDNLSGKKILPLISCRSYWRFHFLQLKYILSRRKAEVLEPVVFKHTGAEPWRTIGVFLKLAGKVPESGKSWIGRYYNKFGHTKTQLEFAQRLGEEYAEAMQRENGLEERKTAVVGDIETIN